MVVVWQLWAVHSEGDVEAMMAVERGCQLANSHSLTNKKTPKEKKLTINPKGHWCGGCKTVTGEWWWCVP